MSAPRKLRDYVNTLYDQAIALSKEGKLEGSQDEYVMRELMEYVTKTDKQ